MWEYRIYELPYELERCETELNAMGSEEWEVVGVAPRDWVSSSNASGGQLGPALWSGSFSNAVRRIR
jgi:hypothetical protein